jgi:hypothetical protein
VPDAADFVTSDDDLAWLMALVGREHATVFPSGGHDGNLDRPDVQSRMMGPVADLLASGAAAR